MSDIEQRFQALEEKVAGLQDQIAIYQLIAHYGPLADGADNEDRRQKTGALFSENGVYDLGNDWKAHGPQEVADMLAGDMHRDLIAHGSAHVMGLPYVLVDGDRATAFSYSRVYRHRDGVFTVWRVAANRWELVRGERGWEVTRRINRLLDGNEESKALLRDVDTIA